MNVTQPRHENNKKEHAHKNALMHTRLAKKADLCRAIYIQDTYMYYVFKHIDKVSNKKVRYIINLESLERNFRHLSLILKRTIIFNGRLFSKISKLLDKGQLHLIRRLIKPYSATR